MGERDIRYEFADFAVYLLPPVLFFNNIMIANINNFGVVNFYENNNSNNHTESKEVEDITPLSSSGAPHENAEKRSFFCRITKAAYDAGKAPVVEDELRSACVSAPKLIKTIRTNEALGYLDTQNLSSKELYELLDEHFELPFKVRTFQDCRSK